MRTLHELAQRVSPGQAIPLGPDWGFYDSRQQLVAETWKSPQVAHANHGRNSVLRSDGTRFMHWYNRLVSRQSLAGDHGYGGAGIIHQYRYTTDLGLGFKIHFCHRANFLNYLLQIQQSGYATIWKEDRRREGGYGRVIAKARHDVKLGEMFEWSVEVDGRGGIRCLVNDTEVSVKDESPITTGSVGYRLDRVDVSIIADGFTR